MPDDQTSVIFENEREWRRHLLSEIKEIRKDQHAMGVTLTNLRVKFAGVAALVAAFTSAITTVVVKKLGL